jgi:tyrosine-protein kinase Etk/Wzc
MRLNLLNTVKGIKNGLKVTRDKLMEQDEFYEMRLKDAPTQEREFTNIQRQMYLKQELYIYLLQQKAA